MNENRSPRNKTLSLDAEQRASMSKRLLRPEGKLSLSDFTGKVMLGDMMEVMDYLPDSFVDLMIIDPPYNLDKDFNGMRFSPRKESKYEAYLEGWMCKIPRLLKPNATIYVCGDWHCSFLQRIVMGKYFTIRNRITWQREKGKGALTNWKNCCEDIWFATAGDEYVFNVDAVKQRKKVIAPYKENGVAKDWEETSDGRFRMTSPSNFWDDISIPYWSMPENTEHPTQKPEKLLAKLILASSNPGDFVFDPFLGSGSTAVTAKKLGRNFSGIEINEEYCCWAEARLLRADEDKNIQGYSHGVFWERNSFAEQSKSDRKEDRIALHQLQLKV